MSDIEEGEIEGELAEAPPPPPPPGSPRQDYRQQQPKQQKAQPQVGLPKERLLAPATTGRAPYYADPDTNGFKGRGGGGGKKKRKKAAALAAAGFVDVYGQGACAEIELYREQGPIRLSDVQNLLLWVLGEGSNPRWCFVKNKPLVKKVVLLAAHGLDVATWLEAGASRALPAWRRHLGEPMELQARNATLAPGSTAHSLLTVPQTRKRRREDLQQQQQQPLPSAAESPAADVTGNGVAAAANQDGSLGAQLTAEGEGAAAGAASTAAGAAAQEAAVAAVAIPAAGLDLHEAAHGVAAPADAGEVDQEDSEAVQLQGTGSTPVLPAAPKRLKVAEGEDVGSRVVRPQLEGEQAAADEEADGKLMTAGATSAPHTAAANGTAANGTAAVAAATGGHPLEQQQHGAAAEQEAAQQGEQQQKQPTAQQQQKQEQGQEQQAVNGNSSMMQTQRRYHHRPCTLPPSHYVLTLEELQQHGYPLPKLDEATGEMVCPEGFVATKSSKGTPPLHDLVALDCEMCITDAGFELTRAVLVDRQGQVLLDELVVPFNPITDHNTRYSGITAEMLQGVTTRLPDVQARLRQLVAAETLLVAHSGDNDLQALKIIHANVIDTSVLYPHPRGPPFKSALRVLASRHLTRTIQQGEHNPVEDARAALDLALLKFERGPAYGAGGGERGERLVEVLGAAGRRSTLVDRLEFLSKQVAGDCSAVVAEADAAVVAALCRELAKPQGDFLWGQLSALQEFYETRLAVARASGQPEPTPGYQLQQEQHDGQQQEAQQQQQEQMQQQEKLQQQQQQQQAALEALDASLAAVWAAAPAGTMVVVVTGQGDTSYSRYLQEQKWRRQQGLPGQQPWSPACEAHLAAWQARVQSALCFAAVKRWGEAQQAKQAQQAQQAQQVRNESGEGVEEMAKLVEQHKEGQQPSMVDG